MRDNESAVRVGTGISGTSRVVWLDVVRLVAMFTVVCCHCTDPFNFYPGTAPDIGRIKLWGAVYGAFLRPCVPLFVMITGALLLPVSTSASVFYKKRIPRVLWPFLLWSLLYALFPWLTGVLGLAPETMQVFFPYSGEEAMRQSLGVSLGYVAGIPLNFSPIAVHMWYIYLLIGLYLYLPVFSAWVEKASRKAQRNFLAVWAVTLFIPYFQEFVDGYLWGTCSWNAFGMLYYFAGFNGYLLLGHYLRNTEWSLGRTIAVGIPLFAAGYAVTFLGFRYMTADPDCTPEGLELFFTYCSPNVLAMTLPVFMLCKKVRVRSVSVRNALADLTACGFGVYMIHYFLTGPSVALARAAHIPIALQIPAAAVLAFAVSWIVVRLIRKAAGSKARYIVG